MMKVDKSNELNLKNFQELVSELFDAFLTLDFAAKRGLSSLISIFFSNFIVVFYLISFYIEHVYFSFL